MSEYLHVEKPFLYQWATLGWTVLDQSVGVIPKILKVMQENGSPAPEFESDDGRTHFLIRLPVHSRAPRLTTGEVTPQVTQQVTPQVHLLLTTIRGELTRAEIMEGLELKDRMHFANEYLQPALDAGLIEMTIPDKPTSSKQRYRLTDQGRRLAGKVGGAA